MPRLNLTFAVASCAGRESQANDDRWFADPAKGCFVVADGVGQSNVGGLAANLAVQCLPRLLGRSLASMHSGDGICEGHIAAQIERLNGLIREQSVSRPSLGSLQTTLVAAIFRAGRLFIANLGDSRAYRWSQGALRQLTQDHNVQASLQRAGHPFENCHQRRELTRYLGMPDPAAPDVHAFCHAVQDVILLFTDGVAGQLRDDEIASLLIPSSSLQVTADRLIERASRSGGIDDKTVLLVGSADRLP